MKQDSHLNNYDRILHFALGRRGVGDHEKIKAALGRLLAIADYVRERGGHPTPAETVLARKLVATVCGKDISPRNLGISLRQLGLNAKAQANLVIAEPTAADDWAHS